MNNKKNKIKPWIFNCPECKQPHAYQGLLFVECTNMFCKNYTEKQEKLVNEYLAEQKKEYDLIESSNYSNKTNIDTDTDFDDNGFDSFGIIQLP